MASAKEVAVDAARAARDALIWIKLRNIGKKCIKREERVLIVWVKIMAHMWSSKPAVQKKVLPIIGTISAMFICAAVRVSWFSGQFVSVNGY